MSALPNMRVGCTAAIVCLAATASCGGSSGPSEDARLTGTLLDSPVAGVFYATDTLSGVTDEDGSFEYVDGETVRFSLGGTTLGESPGQARLSPFELAGISAPVDDDSFNAVFASGELFRAVNIAFLLQTLDLDGAPEDGIEISEEIVALFEGVELDLDRDPQRFRNDHDFRRILNEANRRSLFSTHRVIADLVAVMEHLYGSLRLELALTELASQSLDTDGNGVPDAALTLEFDGSGRAVAQSVDSDANGTVDSRQTRTYDAIGNLIRTDLDVGADGTIDHVTRQTEFDSAGNVLRLEVDVGDDGILDSIVTTTYATVGWGAAFARLD